MASKKIYLSVVIPAYNEEKTVASGVLEGVYEYLAKQKYGWEMVLVNDGSSDDTLAALRKFAKGKGGVRVMNEPHRGKAGTVIAGMLASKGEIALFTDMDQSTPIDQVEKVLPKFKAGADVVIGSRAGRKGAPIVRKLMAYGFSTLRALILGLPYGDTQCGFKAFSRSSVDDIFGRMQLFNKAKRVEGALTTAGFDIELLFIARKLKLKVAPVEVEWHFEEGAVGKNPVKESISGLRDMIKIRLNDLSGKYGAGTQNSNVSVKA